MPAGTKTFMRQKVTLDSSQSTPVPVRISELMKCETNAASGTRAADDENMLNERNCRDIGKREKTTRTEDVCLKANDNQNGASGGGVLRYAIHLRFICPPTTNVPLTKKSLRSKNGRVETTTTITSDSSEEGVPEERRFYMYNDMRVVFPQRHFDADEGKLKVECDYPENPKYFDIGKYY
ncbi:uncharacterized protein LOC124927765 isoform X2 [Impatiens glandulifera]|uniref:uncharacterized protein LOC124927765 isoform X2 n=1 Tax=Impatiens glandulifera TaxID=253017 RepID=UPI001FB0C2A5|nr:uncharacterized protein LOC124927765 isoform X2 [Impatiens glandulifera]